MKQTVMRNHSIGTFFAVVIFSFFQMQAQEGFKVGVQVGTPLGDFNESLLVALGLDASYMQPLGKKVDIGPAAGFIYGVAETFGSSEELAGFESIQFANLSGGIRFWTSNYLSLGGNVGYAFGITEGLENGLYYRPTLAYLVSSSFEANLSYTAVQFENADWSSVTLGLVLNLNPRSRERRH